MSMLTAGVVRAEEVFLSAVAPSLASMGVVGDAKVAVSGGYASSPHSVNGEDFSKSYDGDHSTMYHSNYNGTQYPITLTYELSNASVVDYAIYYPRQNGRNGLFKKVEIWVKDVAGSEVKVMDKDFRGEEGATRIDFEPALRSVATIRFVVNSSVGDEGRAFASCAEMEFYRKNTGGFDPLTLFTDASCSELKPDVRQADIDACPSRFFKNMASSMQAGSYPRSFRIAAYSAYPDPAEDAAKNKTNKRSRFDNPTGIAVNKGDTLVMLVSGMENGYSAYLKIQDLDGESEGKNFYNNGAAYTFSNGVNVIAADNAGLLYVVYFRPDYATAPKLKVHFATGTVNGYYDSQQHTAEQWSALLANASYKYFDVLGKRVHLTFPTESFRVYTKTRGRELVELYDSLVYLEESFMGLLPEPKGYGYTEHSNPMRNRVYMVVIYNSFMNATDYRTAYSVGTMNTVCDVSALKNENNTTRDAIWGPAHEIGHVHQTRPGFEWLGMTEVTNNLHSIYVQANVHGNHDPAVNTRLQKESMVSEGGYLNRYEKAMNLYFLDSTPHNKPNLDVFCKLVPLWQLHLYLTNVAGKTGRHGAGFYEDIYQAVREDMADAGRTAGEHQLEFVKTVCRTAQLNLEDFFALYGFLTPIDEDIEDYGTGRVTVTQAQISQTLTYIRQWSKPATKGAIQYITDENVEKYKSGEGIVAYELREKSEPESATGALKRVYVYTKSRESVMPKLIPSVPTGQSLYAVDVNGNRNFIR
jgi:hypothetical protein